MSADRRSEVLQWAVPEKTGEILKHPKAMAAMMEMVKHQHARSRGEGVTPTGEDAKTEKAHSH